MTSFKKFQPQYVSNKVSANLFELLQGYRNHLSVVEHKKTFLLLKKAFLFLQTLQQQKQTILFINNNPKFSFLVKNTANSLNQPYSNEYWIPGLFSILNIILVYHLCHFQTTIQAIYKDIRRIFALRLNRNLN